MERNMKIGIMKPWENIDIFKAKNFWKGAGLFLLFIAALAFVQFGTPGLVGNDGYYHIKIAYLIRTQGFKPVFDYLPLSVLNPDEYVDHHYLFHLLMVPFTFGDLRIGAKLASTLFPAMAFISIWWMLEKRQVEYPILWSLGLLAISEAFLYRMSMPRAQSLSLFILMISLFAMFEKKRWQLVLLGFVYVWAYNAFPLLIITALAYIAAYWLVNRVLQLQPLLYSTIGVSIGLVINPYFPENLAFIYRHLAPKLADATSVSAGNEWFPYTTSALIENSGFAFLIFFLGVVALGLSEKKLSVETATSLFLVIAFGFMLFQSRRFIEYAPPMMLIFAAFAWSSVIQQRKQNSGKFHREGPDEMSSKSIPGVIFLTSLFAVLIAALLWFNLGTSRKVIQENARPYQRFAEASAWLIENTPPNSLVFQTDWDDFPQLFFYNTHNTYTIGLDPTYMQLFDEGLYDQWINITEGDVENPSDAIWNQFGAQYVLTDLNHKDFIREANEDPSLVLMYQDEYAMIFQLNK